MDYWKGVILEYFAGDDDEPKVISNTYTTMVEIKLIGKLAENKGGVCLLVDSNDYKNLHIFKNRKLAEEFQAKEQ